MTTSNNRGDVSAAGWPNQLLPLFIVIIGCVLFVLIAQRIDSSRSVRTASEVESLYLKGSEAKRLSLSFNGLMADWYWMRSLQYVGRKVLNAPADVQIDNLGQLNLKLLAPLLDISTTLDPQFMEPYQYAAVVLPDVDVNEAIRIVRKGIAANPNAWRLYQHLGYIYWQQKDFQTAAEMYSKGSSLPGAPQWMVAMKAQMAAEGGSRDTAIQIYQRMYQESDDPNIREMAAKRLLQIQSFIERDAIRRILSDYSNRTRQCPSAWKSVADSLRSAGFRIDVTGAPLDPADAPYRLTQNGCDVELDPGTKVPR